jgi:hypothetical protein
MYRLLRALPDEEAEALDGWLRDPDADVADIVSAINALDGFDGYISAYTVRYHRRTVLGTGLGCRCPA